MSNCAILGDIASGVKPTIDKIVLQPQNQYAGTELSDDRFRKIYATYCALVLEQYTEDLAKEIK